MELLLLSKESGAFIGHWYPVFGINIKLFFGSSQFLLKFVNVGYLHSVHERQSLLRKKKSDNL